MYGENRKLITRQCITCGTHVAMRVDPEDAERHVKQGVFVQDAFADRNGRPYLTATERELWISKVCDFCWHALCSSDRLAYS